MSPEQEKQFREQREFEVIRNRASRVFQANGKIMPARVDETPNQHRVRLMNALQKTPWTLGLANDPAELARQEAKVMSRALEAAHRSPTLNEVVYADATGRQVSEFYGQKSAWMGPFKDTPKLMTGINKKPFRL